MIKLSFFLLTSILSLFAFVIGYKIGDSRGYEAGYKAGYIYDCQAEVKELRQQHEDLKKAVDFADRKSNEVKLENWRLKRHVNEYHDSLKNVELVKHRQDSISKLPGNQRNELSVDPYTGEVRKNILYYYRKAQEKEQKK